MVPAFVVSGAGAFLWASLMAIDSFAQEPDLGLLFVMNGIDTPMAWDGFADSFFPIGMDASSVAPVLAAAGAGPIVGQYFAYERFVDTYGNVSNLSPISLEFTAQGTTGSITGVTSATPIVITSPGHGLPTGTFVKITGVGGIDTANDTWQMTSLTANTFSLDDSIGDGFSAYSGGGTWISGIHQINYSSVQVPAESKVVRRQILRNTDGQATTFYVDVETADLAATTFSSTRTDTELATQTRVPLLDSDGQPFANGNGKPFSFFKCMATAMDRMFSGVLLEYNVGSASVTFGSATIQGAGTQWASTFAGRFLYVDGASQSYEILSVDPVAQTLTLTEAYHDPTDLFAFYSIKPPPAYRRIIQFTQAGKAQSWPATFGVSIPETGDELTGLMAMNSFLFILERENVHKFTFSLSPFTDGAVFPMANRGCVNNRCWITVDGAAFMLDELGAYKFTGSNQVDSISDGIQSLFRRDDDVDEAKINWSWKEYFHASLDRQRSTIRWYVSLDGNRYPSHALCYQYREQKWWKEKQPLLIGGTCAGYLGGAPGTPQAYSGGSAARVVAPWTGTTDLVNPSEGTIRSTVTDATAFTLMDAAASFADVVNAPISIVHGLGSGQTRNIVFVDGIQLSLDLPWSTIPDTDSVYQIGGVEWLYRSSWFRLGRSEEMDDRRFELIFSQLSTEGFADLRFFSDFTGVPDKQMVSMKADQGGGVESNENEASLTIDLQTVQGLVSLRQPGSKEFFGRGKRYQQFDLHGYTNEEAVRIFQFMWEGFVPHEGGGG